MLNRSADTADGVKEGRSDRELSDTGVGETGVAIATIASPENRNALTTELLLDLITALEKLDADRTVSVAVLTGGTQLFASGADVRALLEVTPAEYARSPRADCWRRLNGLGLPLVAAVAGYALGGGCELALVADIVVAGDTAVFGQPEARLGLIPGAGGTQRWARVAGRHVAAEVVLAGRTVDAFEARDLGLVALVVPAEARRRGGSRAGGPDCDGRAARAARRDGVAQSRR